MKMNFHCKEKKDKQKLLQDLTELTGSPSKYMGPPSFSYIIGNATVDRDGIIEIDENAFPEEAERIAEGLMDRGYEGEAEKEVNGLCLSFPRNKISDEGIARLQKLLEAKGGLIKKALGIESVDITIEEDRVSFPWFDEMPSPDEVDAYGRFICSLCSFAQHQKRVTATEKNVKNEKFAFRTFLLRLGFIGDEPELKKARKVLLSKLSGSSAFRQPHKADTAADSGLVPTAENTVGFNMEEAKERLNNPEVREEIKAILNGEDTENEDAE